MPATEMKQKSDVVTRGKKQDLEWFRDLMGQFAEVLAERGLENPWIVRRRGERLLITEKEENGGYRSITSLSFDDEPECLIVPVQTLAGGGPAPEVKTLEDGIDLLIDRVVANHGDDVPTLYHALHRVIEN